MANIKRAIFVGSIIIIFGGGIMYFLGKNSFASGFMGFAIILGGIGFILKACGENLRKWVGVKD